MSFKKNFEENVVVFVQKLDWVPVMNMVEEMSQNQKSTIIVVVYQFTRIRDIYEAVG